jgi:hypothetical protein
MKRPGWIGRDKFHLYSPPAADVTATILILGFQDGADDSGVLTGPNKKVNEPRSCNIGTLNQRVIGQCGNQLCR